MRVKTTCARVTELPPPAGDVKGDGLDVLFVGAKKADSNGKTDSHR
jgi:hypothetical protein